MHLTHELTQMKNLCNSILALMTKYANSQQENASFLAEKPSSPLDLLPVKRFAEDNNADTGVGQSRVKTEEEEGSPRLFGVSIGVKRAKGSDEEQEHQQQEEKEDPPRSEVKSEPPDQQEHPWLKCSPQPNQRVCN
nr:TPA_asm: hypothetical protein HUJ06_017913 [Nelumbo nucifera]